MREICRVTLGTEIVRPWVTPDRRQDSPAGPPSRLLRPVNDNRPGTAKTETPGKTGTLSSAGYADADRCHSIPDLGFLLDDEPLIDCSRL